MEPLPSQPPSCQISWLRVGSIAVLAVVALVLILFGAWSLSDFTESDPRAIPHFPIVAVVLQLLTKLACLISPFTLLGLITFRERVLGMGLGFLIVLASTSLAGATWIYARSSAARVYFAALPNQSPGFLFDTLTFTFLAGMAIIGMSMWCDRD